MIKISALNEESSEESEEEDVPTITKEAQEQIALTEYNKALELLKESKQTEALNIFRDLLETELLDDVVKPEIPDGRSRPMLSLKYSCFKNIAAIEAAQKNYESAIESYCEAASLDDSDVTLWCRIGVLAMEISNLELACSSFKQGLKCNPNHWPCLDNIITALYAVPDYMNCLLYISMALERDPYYVKGLAFRDEIFKQIPCLKECYKLYNSDWELDPPLHAKYDYELGDKLIAEAKEVAQKWAESCRREFIPKSLPSITLRRPLTEYTWLEMGESLLDMHKYIAENDMSFVCPVKLSFVKRNEEVVKAPRNGNDEKCIYMDVDERLVYMESLEEVYEMDKNAKSESEDVNVRLSDTWKKTRELNGAPESAMDVEAEDDKKSCSTDVQIIEDDDALRVSDVDILQLREQDRSNNANLEIDANGEKAQRSSAMEDMYQVDAVAQNEKLSDKESDKSSDRPYDKIPEKESESLSKSDDKSNEKIEGKEEGQKVKKRRRSALCFLQQWAWSCSSMRRSARVRTSNRRETERDDVLLEETLRRMFPSSLLPDTVKLTKDDPSKGMDDSMDTMDLYQLFANHENVNSNTGEGIKSSESSKSPSPDMGQHKYFGTELESLDVKTFIADHSGQNLMVILAKFTEFLCTKWNRQWPDGMTEIYLQTYSFTRQHIPHPSPFDDDDSSDNILKLDVEMTVLFGELHTDRWLDNKPDILPSSTLDKLGTGLPSEELGHIIFASAREDLWNEENIFILLRVLWLKANIFFCQGDVDIVIETLELLSNQMKELESQKQNVCLRLPNCKCNSRISRKIAEKRLTSIQRGQKLGEIENLYNEKKYAELSFILQDTFKFAKQRHKFLTISENIVDRAEQLSMLLESLWQLEQYEECYVWSEACLNEAWQNYLNASDEADQKKWAGSILNSLGKLEACTHQVSAFVVKYLPESRLTRLVQNLVHIVCHQLDVSDTTVELPLETVLPWILLHYILQYEEDKERAKSESSYKTRHQNSHHSESDDEDEGIPASMMILFTAHEFLGRHSWCCFNDAKLLFFTMNLVIPKLETPQLASIKNKLTKYLEQIFYCLYGHSNRVNKARPKYLEDHVVPRMDLTWEGAQLLFDFYKPKQLPEFQSPRPASISVDTEVLFKRIIRLVPAESDPSLIADEMSAYIIGERDKMPTVKKPLPYSISSIYYLLGDFYFKNSKWTYAARYYLFDLCLSPSGLNSWAGLAMATGTVIENWLKSYRPISEDKFLAKAKIAQSSYRHALELSPAHIVIWTEYGNFVYMVHSFCSRLLKQESDTLSMERFAVLESRKEDTLEIANQCFQSANRIFVACQDIDDMSKLHDERWLYQYMLGKVAEKKNLDPRVFLQYYARASELLHQNNAHYPRRISHKSPQNLSIEALEVYYRIHASILKYLEQHESKPLKKSLGELFHWHLKNCSEGPFMKYRSKLIDRRKEEFSPDVETKIAGKESGSNAAEGAERAANVHQRSNSIEEIEIIDKTSKRSSDVSSRKRSPDDFSNDNTKRIKLTGISHLQLMQDVVALIDDLITKVCEMVPEREKATADDAMVLSSDESNEWKSQKRKMESGVDAINQQLGSQESVNNLLDSAEKTENVQDLMDALMKQAMEMSQETQQSSPDDEDTRKFEGKWLQSEDLQITTDKETKDKTGDKRKGQNGIGKEEVCLSRRGSQESTTTTQTTTTTTETNNSSSSSSDESSSSEDSSESDSSSDSDSESAESETDKKKRGSDVEEKEKYMTEEEVNTLIAYCLAGLEQCILRFSEHHKSFYRLSHFFFNYKTSKDTSKCKDLLLGTYHCQFYPGQSFQGLFAERKSTNFFSGVWHIPNREIDRPGSFASHISRCVTLLMQVLKETNDSRMLMQLCIQLGKIPDPDKKYLRDSEREQLSRQALTLCLQSLRSRVQSMGLPNTVENVHLIRTDARTQVLLDVYKIYQQVQKHFQNKESTVQAFSALLIDTYKIYIGNKDLEGNILEMAMKCCHRQILANKMATTSIAVTNVQTQVTPVNTVPASQSASIPNSTSPQSSQSHRKAYKTLTSTGRPRGRPPNVNKYLQAMQQSGSNAISQFGMKSSFSNYMATGNRPLVNPYFMNPLVDPNMLSAILASGLGGNMMDPLSAMTYLNQVGNYQDILRQYQNNLTSLTNLASGLSSAAASVAGINNVPPALSTTTASVGVASSIPVGTSASNLSNLTVQQFLGLSSASSSIAKSASAPTYDQGTSKTTTTTACFTKDRPNISITPVNTIPLKGKTVCKQSPQTDSHHPHPHSSSPSSISATVSASASVSLSVSVSVASTLPVHVPKSLQISQATKPVAHPSTTQVSLLKPSVIQQVKTTASPPKQISAPQLRVSKSLTEPQPAHNTSLSHSPLKSSVVSQNNNPAALPQLAHSTMGPVLSIKQQQQQPPPPPPPPQSLTINLPSVRAGTSLQHKLLSKKNSQRSYPQTSVHNTIRKQKSAKGTSMMSSNLSNLLNTMSSGASMQQPTTFIPPELSGISVSPVSPSGMKGPSSKLSGYKKPAASSSPSAGVATASAASSTSSSSSSSSSLSLSTVKTKTCTAEAPGSLIASNAFSQAASSVEALSMLTQLQQHSHLEIIPQQKSTQIKSNVDFPKNTSATMSALPQKLTTEVSRSAASTMECVSMYDLSRSGTSNKGSGKRAEKHGNDSVEIITLDD